MKYMTFNSSCSYAGIANMLEQYGIDTSDRSIALAMKLPYLFSYCDGVYLSGTRLQSAEWFNLYLNPIGYELIEKIIPVEEVTRYLKVQKTAMFGIPVKNGGKHAIVYMGMESNQFIFLNNKWEKEETPEKLQFTEDELKATLDSLVMIATLNKVYPTKVNFVDKLRDSITILQKNLEDIIELCYTKETIEVLRSQLNRLFRPLFLEGISMLNMIEETELAKDFASLQQELLATLKQDSNYIIFLKDYISIDKLKISTEKYIGLIENVVENLIKER